MNEWLNGIRIQIIIIPRLRTTIPSLSKCLRKAWPPETLCLWIYLRRLLQGRTRSSSSSSSRGSELQGLATHATGERYALLINYPELIMLICGPSADQM